MLPFYKRACIRRGNNGLSLREVAMAIPNTKPRKIRPTHPGEMLRDDFMPDYNLTVTSLAEKLGVSRQTINELLNEDRAVSSTMALRLSKLFGNTPEFWLNAQLAVELWEAQKRCRKDLERIRMLKAG